MYTYKCSEYVLVNAQGLFWIFDEKDPKLILEVFEVNKNLLILLTDLSLIEREPSTRWIRVRGTLGI